MQIIHPSSHTPTHAHTHAHNPAVIHFNINKPTAHILRKYKIEPNLIHTTFTKICPIYYQHTMREPSCVLTHIVALIEKKHICHLIIQCFFIHKLYTLLRGTFNKQEAKKIGQYLVCNALFISLKHDMLDKNVIKVCK